MNFGYDGAVAFAAVASGMTLTYGGVRVLEMITPRTTFGATSQLRSLRFWPYYIAVSVLCAFAGKAIHAELDIVPYISIKGQTLYQASGLGFFNYIIWPVLSLIVLDFFHYWKHRIQHKFFWRFHAIHHSIEDLSAINSYHHWSDPVFSLILASIPMAFLIGFDTPTFAVFAFLIAAQGPFIHSNTKIHYGPLNRILVDNRFHRIHHSVEQRHFNKNFGERSTIWDQLFGTAHFPRPNEWPRTGIAEEPEPVRTKDYLWRPFWRDRTPSSAPSSKILRVAASSTSLVLNTATRANMSSAGWSFEPRSAPTFTSVEPTSRQASPRASRPERNWSSPACSTPRPTRSSPPMRRTG